MCGFVGAVGLDRPVAPELARQVLDVIGHRGPNGEGTFTEPTVWLGFRRLSILDLTHRADQPMAHPSGLRLVFNGEIYNYVELRDELLAHGHRFVTSSDTEVLLAGYAQWGASVFERCDGMFAVAIYDPARRSVVLARDRFGEKPLYVGRTASGAWWFGSSAHALALAGVGSGRVDAARIAAFLGLRDVEDPARSYFDGVHQLPAGTSAVVASGVTELAPRRWFHLDRFVTEATSRPALDPEEVRHRLVGSVRRRLRSDVEVGTSLSGGVDSSVVVAAMRAVDPDRPIHTFTASFPGSTLDEWEYARRTADKLNLVAHRVEPTFERFAADLDRLVGLQEAPFDSPSVFAQWEVMRAAAASGVTVLLDGQGADETWGGYPKYRLVAAAEMARRGQLRPLRALLAGGGVTPAALERSVPYLIGPGGRRVALAVRRRLRPVPPALAAIRPGDPLGECTGGSPVARVVHADLGRVILPRLLRYADRNSMAWSREVRLPFLSIDVVEAGLRSDWPSGMATGWTKHGLRSAVEGWTLPEILWRRDKVAYEVPAERWSNDADAAELVAGATSDLVARGLLTSTEDRPVGAWALVALSRFLARFRLELP